MTDNIRSKIAAWVDSEYGSCPVAGTQLLAFIDSQQAKVAALKAERDELLAALKPFAGADLTSPGVRATFGFDVLRARAAIAKAEGRKE